MTQLYFANLGSGSRGNCSFVGNSHSGVLIDCGLSCRQIFSRLEEVGLGLPHIDAVLITHEHSDHVAACRILEDKLRKRQTKAPSFFMTSGTAEGLGAKVRPIDITLITAGAPFRVDSWLIEPYSVPHDTRDPVAFVIERDGLRTGTISDLGRSTRLVERQLASMDVALVEFNHDIDMLMDGSYPWSLKQRVSGDQGHLSNAQAAELLNRGASERLSHVLLGHISEENNTPELVLDSAETAIRHSAFPTIRIELANQKAPTLVEVKRTPKQPATINAETNEGQQLLFT